MIILLLENSNRILFVAVNSNELITISTLIIVYFLVLQSLIIISLEVIMCRSNIRNIKIRLLDVVTHLFTDNLYVIQLMLI